MSAQRAIAATAALVLIIGTVAGVGGCDAQSGPASAPAAHSTSRPQVRQVPVAAGSTAITVAYAAAGSSSGTAGTVETDAQLGGPTVSAGISAAPYSQCPAVGVDTGCGELIVLTPSGAVVARDLAQGSYDGTGAALVGVVNDSGRPVRSLSVQSPGAFAFRGGGGICADQSQGSAAPAACPFGSTGYEGKGVAFSDRAADGSAGTVRFTAAAGLAPHASAYFALAQQLTVSAAPAVAAAAAGTGSTVTTAAAAAPDPAEQGGAPNPSETQAPCASGPPVNCASGALWEQFEDFSLPEPAASLSLIRTYSSANENTPSPFGYGWSFSCGMNASKAANGAVTISQEDGSTVTFTPNGSGYSAPPRALAKLTADADGGYTLTRYGSALSYVFNAAGQLTSESDPAGQQVSLTYTAGQLSTVAENTRKLTFTYSGSLVSKVTDSLGRSEVYGYDAAGDLISATDNAGRSWAIDYYPGTHLLQSIADPQGRLTSVDYDSADRVASETDAPDGALASWSYAGNPYAASGGTTTVTDPDGHVTLYEFADLDLLATVVDPAGSAPQTTSYSYSPAGLPLSSANPDADTMLYAYNAHGDLTSSTDPLGRTTGYTYTNTDELATETQPDASAPVVTNGYDANGELVSQTDGDGDTTKVARDTQDPDEIAAITTPGGRTTGYSYDADGDLTKSVDAAGDTTDFGYDADGELTCEADPTTVAAGNTCAGSQQDTTRYAYDAIGRPTSLTNPAGQVTKTGYYDEQQAQTLGLGIPVTPDQGDTIVQTSPRGDVTAQTYDTRGELLFTTQGGKQVSTSTYDLDGDPLTMSEGSSTTTYKYDAFGRLWTSTNPDGNITTYTYDAAGNLATIVNPMGATTRYSYDAAGEATAIDYSDGSTPDVSYTYYPTGLREQMTDGTGTTKYTYDGDGRLTSQAAPGGTVSYQYDGDGEQTQLTYPNGKAVTSKFNKAGEVSSTTDWLSGTTSFQYDQDGTLTSEQYPNGVTASYSGGEVTDTRGAAQLAVFATAVNANGQIDTAEGQVGGPGAAAGTSQYTYNTLTQLATLGGAAYSYDALGDITAFPSGTTQTFDSAGELRQASPAGATGAAATLSYAFNADGDRTGQGPAGDLTTLTYDQADRLTGYGSKATYTYDGDGLRATKTVDGSSGPTTDTFVWDQAPSTPLLLTDGTDSYVYGPGGQPIEQIDGTTPAYLLSDPQGSTRVLTNSAGKVTGAYDYGPYGKVLTHTGSASTPLQFDGQYTDAESGLQYLRARYYDPATGSFLTPDPAQATTGTPYAFGGDDPLDQADPSGLSWYNPFSWTAKTWEVVIGAAGLVALTVLTDGADLPVVAAGAEDLAANGGAAAAEAAVENTVAGEASGSAASALGGGAAGTLAADVTTGDADLGAQGFEDSADAAQASKLPPTEGCSPAGAQCAAEPGGGPPPPQQRGMSVFRAVNAAYDIDNTVNDCKNHQWASCFADAVFTVGGLCELAPNSVCRLPKIPRTQQGPSAKG